MFANKQNKKGDIYGVKPPEMHFPVLLFAGSLQLLWLIKNRPHLMINQNIHIKFCVKGILCHNSVLLVFFHWSLILNIFSFCVIVSIVQFNKKK